MSRWTSRTLLPTTLSQRAVYSTWWHSKCKGCPPPTPPTLNKDTTTSNRAMEFDLWQRSFNLWQGQETCSKGALIYSKARTMRQMKSKMVSKFWQSKPNSLYLNPIMKVMCVNWWIRPLSSKAKPLERSNWNNKHGGKGKADLLSQWSKACCWDFLHWWTIINCTMFQMTSNSKEIFHQAWMRRWNSLVSGYTVYARHNSFASYKTISLMVWRKLDLW